VRVLSLQGGEREKVSGVVRAREKAGK